jgi:pilus assembly protein Flp/PilA
MLDRLTHWAMKGYSRVQDIRSEEGQALVEYGLILALIAVVSVGALTALGVNVAAQLQTIADDIAAA